MCMKLNYPSYSFFYLIPFPLWSRNKTQSSKRYVMLSNHKSTQSCIIFTLTNFWIYWRTTPSHHKWPFALRTTPHVNKGVKRLIWDNFTWFPKYFWQMTITRSEGINKDDTYILNFAKTKLLVSANTSVVLTEEIRIAKLCTEVFVMLKHLMTKLNIP